MCMSTDSIDPFVTGNSSRLTSVASEAWASKFSETGVETELVTKTSRKNLILWGQGEVTKGVIPNHEVYSLYITSCYLEYLGMVWSSNRRES